MALPVSPAPRSDDIAVHGWHGITVRVAWTLLAQGVKVRPQVLRDAREHVLYHLDKAVSLQIAEDLASQLTVQFVQRARGRWVADPWAMDASMPLSPRWRRAIERSLDPAGELVFRRHLCDGRTLEWLESRHAVDRLVLDSAKGGLREVIRRQAQLDGVPIADWPPDRIDRLLCRLAGWAPGPCPPIGDLLEGQHREHVTQCARCDRTVRLVRGDVISAEDLVPPSLGARPERTTSVMAIHFHPDGRRHRSGLQKELSVSSVPYGEDLLLVDGAHAEVVHRALVLATELGVPPRDHIRVSLTAGPGHWSRHGLIGPLADRADQDVRTRGWGTADGLGDLPGVLPDPPSARAWWTAAAALGVAALAIARLTLGGGDPALESGLRVEFTQARGGFWTEFDVDEGAVVAVVRETDGKSLELVVGGSSSADKGDVATGDGRYRLHTLGEGVLVAATSVPVPELAELVRRASEGADPLGALASEIRRQAPGADVRVATR